MSDNRSLPFDQRAYQNFQEEMKDLAGIYARYTGQAIDDEEAPQDQQELENIEGYREPLSYDVRKEITVLLSTGGPEDGYHLIFDTDGEAIRGEYFFKDWFEGKSFSLDRDQLQQVLTVYNLDEPYSVKMM